ncbi:MAG: hypothetical protein KQA34_02625 [Candidatus Aenigmarchaeota archaeon]|nr:hypothetical protein [Candidatus Aenigmarchaeota archaeon]
MKLTKTLFMFLLNFLFFVLPFLIIILGSYEIINCNFFNLNFCKLIFDKYNINIYLLTFLGLVISISSFLSNLLENKISKVFSIIYSIFILIFVAFVLNFGKLEFEHKEFLNFDIIRIEVNFEILFYLILLGLIIYVIRKIFVSFFQ